MMSNVTQRDAKPDPIGGTAGTHTNFLICGESDVLILREAALPTRSTLIDITLKIQTRNHGTTRFTRKS